MPAVRIVGDTTVTGRAWNVKDGALIIADGSCFYYVDGLSAWNKKYNKKKVTVTGKLYIDFNKGAGPGEPILQELVIERQTLKILPGH